MSGFDNSWMPFGNDEHSDPRSLAPSWPTPHTRVAEMVSLGRIVSSDVVLDLGSGSGSVLIALAQATGCRCVGVEIDETLIESSRRDAEEKGLGDRVTILKQDIMEYDKLGEYTVVVMFLQPWSLAMLGPRLVKAVEGGTRVMSYWWELQDQPKRFRAKTGDTNNLYLYEKEPKS